MYSDEEGLGGSMYRSRTERIRWIRWAHRVVIIVACVAGMCCIRNVLQQSRRTQIMLDTYFSPAARATLQASCAEIPRASINPFSLRTLLQHAVSTVRHITIDERHPDQTIITIIAARPCMLINTGLVMTEDARIVSTTEYSSTALEQLPHLTVHDPDHMLDEVTSSYKFLASLPVEIINNYQITWIDPTCIKLTQHLNTVSSVHSTSVIFYVWHLTTFSPQMLRAMEYIPTILRQRSQSRKGTARGAWLIDARVPQYLIVSYAAKEHP
jgi:hypothetical protein